MVEQERPNVFTASVANIGPNETVSIQIEYQDSADIKNGVASLVFPMTVAPRYSPPAETIQLVSAEGSMPVVLDPVLDRHRISSYSLTLIASDSGQQSHPRSDSTQLDIRIVNDSIPIFLQSVYSIDIPEDASIGRNLLRIEAISENNKKIFYELLTESPFVIDRLTGNIQLKKLLDYETIKSYRLTVKAYENVIPVYAIVIIRIIYVNDNPVLIHMKANGKKKKTKI